MEMAIWHCRASGWAMEVELGVGSWHELRDRYGRDTHISYTIYDIRYTNNSTVSTASTYS